MLATEINLVILFKRNYVNLNNNILLNDINEADHIKISLSEAVNKLHKSSFTLIWISFVSMTTTLTSSSYNKGNCHLSLCLYEISLEVACQLQPEL